MVHLRHPLSTSWLTLLVGGLLFGVDQPCVALALHSIGLGLSFIINVGLGCALGVLLPLLTLHSHQIASAAGLATLVGLLFVALGLCLSYYAGRQCNQARGIAQQPPVSAKKIA